MYQFDFIDFFPVTVTIKSLDSEIFLLCPFLSFNRFQFYCHRGTNHGTGTASCTQLRIDMRQDEAACPETTQMVIPFDEPCFGSSPACSNSSCCSCRASANNKNVGLGEDRYLPCRFRYGPACQFHQSWYRNRLLAILRSGKVPSAADYKAYRTSCYQRFCQKISSFHILIVFRYNPMVLLRASPCPLWLNSFSYHGEHRGARREIHPT